jgi:membrane-associated protease RseP (regulator of RpoE activity)
MCLSIECICTRKTVASFLVCLIIFFCGFSARAEDTVINVPSSDMSPPVTVIGSVHPQIIIAICTMNASVLESIGVVPPERTGDGILIDQQLVEQVFKAIFSLDIGDIVKSINGQQFSESNLVETRQGKLISLNKEDFGRPAPDYMQDIYEEPRLRKGTNELVLEVERNGKQISVPIAYDFREGRINRAAAQSIITAGSSLQEHSAAATVEGVLISEELMKKIIEGLLGLREGDLVKSINQQASPNLNTLIEFLKGQDVPGFNDYLVELQRDGQQLYVVVPKGQLSGEIELEKKIIASLAEYVGKNIQPGQQIQPGDGVIINDSVMTQLFGESFHKGDVIKSLNGHPTPNQSAMLKIYQEIKNAPCDLIYDVVRDGHQIKLVLKCDPTLPFPESNPVTR